MEPDSNTCCSELPPWKVLLHNDDHNNAEFILHHVKKIARLEESEAMKCIMGAHENGVALLLTTHQERAELYVEQFESFDIKVTIEKE